MDYVLHILVLVCIYAVASMSLDLLVGQAGLLSVAHAVFFGLGAYSSAIGMTQLHLSFPAAIGLGALISIPASLLITLPSARLRRDYFMLLTFAFQIVCFHVANNWLSVTRGSLGVAGIPAASLFGWELDSARDYLLATGLSALIVFVACERISRGPFGRLLRAIREDETLVRTWGKNPVRAKIAVGAFSAACASVAGSWYAVYIGFIDPSCLDVSHSMLILAMVIVGGSESRLGSLFGAVFLVGMPEALRFLGLSGGTAAHLREMLYGGLLVFMMFIRPQGFFGHYGFTK